MILLENQNLLRSSNRYEYLEKVFFLNMMNQLSVNLAAEWKERRSGSDGR